MRCVPFIDRKLKLGDEKVNSDSLTLKRFKNVHVSSPE